MLVTLRRKEVCREDRDAGEHVRHTCPLSGVAFAVFMEVSY